jgi:WXXGXW repeat (2 copies)
MYLRALRLSRARLGLAVLFVVIAAGLGGCYYVVPAGPPAYGPVPGPPYLVGSVYVPGRWVWNGVGWVWQPGHWVAASPPPPGAGSAPAPPPPSSPAPPPGQMPAPPPKP